MNAAVKRARPRRRMQAALFQKLVYDHFEKHGRLLPWRKTRNPYHILVSEIMLQQTQVDRVVDKNLQFISLFPHIGTLARAHLLEILRVWQGLGYNRFAWFGPTHPDTWAPPGAIHDHWWTPLPCRGCDRTACPHWNCLPGLAPDAAARTVLAHLERHARPAPDLGPAARA